MLLEDRVKDIVRCCYCVSFPFVVSFLCDDEQQPYSNTTKIDDPPRSYCTDLDTQDIRHNRSCSIPSFTISGWNVSPETSPNDSITAKNVVLSSIDADDAAASPIRACSIE